MTIDAPPRPTAVSPAAWILFSLFVAVDVVGVATAFPAERVGYAIVFAAFLANRLADLVRLFVGDPGRRIAAATIDGQAVVTVSPADSDGLWSTANLVAVGAVGAVTSLVLVRQDRVIVHNPVMIAAWVVTVVLAGGSLRPGLRQALGRRPTHLAFRPDGVELRLAKGTTLTTWNEITPTNPWLNRPGGGKVKVTDLTDLGLRGRKLRALVRYAADNASTPAVEQLRALVR